MSAFSCGQRWTKCTNRAFGNPARSTSSTIHCTVTVVSLISRATRFWAPTFRECAWILRTFTPFFMVGSLAMSIVRATSRRWRMLAARLPTIGARLGTGASSTAAGAHAGSAARNTWMSVLALWSGARCTVTTSTVKRIIFTTWKCKRVRKHSVQKHSAIRTARSRFWWLSCRQLFGAGDFGRLSDCCHIGWRIIDLACFQDHFSTSTCLKRAFDCAANPTDSNTVEPWLFIEQCRLPLLRASCHRFRALWYDRNDTPPQSTLSVFHVSCSNKHGLLPRSVQLLASLAISGTITVTFVAVFLTAQCWQRTLREMNTSSDRHIQTSVLQRRNCSAAPVLQSTGSNNSTFTLTFGHPVDFNLCKTSGEHRILTYGVTPQSLSSTCTMSVPLLRTSVWLTELLRAEGSKKGLRR